MFVNIFAWAAKVLQKTSRYANARKERSRFPILRKKTGRPSLYEPGGRLVPEGISKSSEYGRAPGESKFRAK